MQDIPKKHELLFQANMTSLNEIKKQQWVITNYVLLAQAALYVVGKASELWVSYLFAIAALAASVGGLVILRELWAGMKRYRFQINWIVEANFSDEERRARKLGEKHGEPRKDGIFEACIYGVLCVSGLVAAFGLIFPR